VTLTLAIAFGLFAVLTRNWTVHEFGNRALDVARTVAATQVVQANVTHYHESPSRSRAQLANELANGPLQATVSQVRQRTGVLFVVITDDHGITLAHPDITELAGHVSSDPGIAPAGQEKVLAQLGNQGPSVHAKAPIFEPNSDQVAGAVTVGISTRAVHDQLMRDLRIAVAMGGVALLIGIVGSVVLARRWHGLTFGLRPAEMAELLRGQAAMLHGIGEGVLAVDTAWRATVINDEARRLLQVRIELGDPVDEIGLTTRVLDVFRAADSSPAQATVGDRVVVVSARPVTRDGHDLGTVLVVRDRTDVESLTRELDAVQSMSTVLREQRQEFENRLYLLIEGSLAATAPIADVWARLPDAEAIAELRQRSHLLGISTISCESLILMHQILSTLGAPHMIRRHAPSMSAAAKQAVLDAELNGVPVLVNKTVTVRLGAAHLLCTGVGDFTINRHVLAKVASVLGLPKKTAKACRINPPDYSPEHELGLLTGMVSPFVSPSISGRRLHAVVRLGSTEVAHGDKPMVAISLSPFESLLVPLAEFGRLARLYAVTAYPDIEWVEIGD
jgi:hypothetical protein